MNRETFTTHRGTVITQDAVDELVDEIRPVMAFAIEGCDPTDEVEDFDDDHDDKALCITIGVNETLTAWAFQTGDNSYHGAAYGFPYWGVIWIDADSDPLQAALDAVEDAINQML